MSLPISEAMLEAAIKGAIHDLEELIPEVGLKYTTSYKQYTVFCGDYRLQIDVELRERKEGE